MLHEVSVASYNGRDQVQGWVYMPACEPEGVVQLVHGFGEHSRRYLHLIVALMDAGYIVAANDHVGHGKTALANNTWGDWGDAGYQTMREDEHRFKAAVQQVVRQEFPDEGPGLPYYLFGHSMGSMIARDFAACYGDELAGLIICGTAGIFRNTREVLPKVEELCAQGKAHDSEPALAGELMGWMFERCPEGAELGNEWICHDPWVQRDHARDPFDAFTHPVHNISLKYFIQMMLAIEGPEWAEKVPVGLRIYNIAGDQDPVGEFGAGVYQVSNWLAQTGHDVVTKLYPGYRHEIHNYDDLKFEVEEGIVDWLQMQV